MGASLLAVIAGMVLLARNPRPPQAAQPAHTPVLAANAPSSTKPSEDDLSNYKVAPDLPRFLNIPAIKVPKSRIIQLGVTKQNQIASPDNVYDAGWYKNSAKPGQAGAMFIYGHVSSWTANGLFHDLKKLKYGDKIFIEKGDGEVLVYSVDKLKTYPADKVDMNEVLAPVNQAAPGLNLMTCTGKVIKGTSEFDQRLVVFTSLSN